MKSGASCRSSVGGEAVASAGARFAGAEAKTSIAAVRSKRALRPGQDRRRDRGGAQGGERLLDVVAALVQLGVACIDRRQRRDRVALVNQPHNVQCRLPSIPVRHGARRAKGLKVARAVHAVARGAALCRWDKPQRLILAHRLGAHSDGAREVNRT